MLPLIYIMGCWIALSFVSPSIPVREGSRATLSPWMRPSVQSFPSRRCQILPCVAARNVFRSQVVTVGTFTLNSV